MMRNLALSLFAVLACAGTALAAGDGTFRSPLTILNAGRPGPVTVHAGDFNGDGKLDLAAADGSPIIQTFIQDPANRNEWKRTALTVGSTVVFVRSADFDADGNDDIVAADSSAKAFFIRSRGDGSFARPVEVKGSDGSRWTAVGDWNRDGKMDFATANISAANLTVFLGDGSGGFTLSDDLLGSREHTLEALDYDGDGIEDLVLGAGLVGLQLQKGNGNGTFAPKAAFTHMGCVEYLAEVGHWEGKKYVLKCDLNKDGLGDLVPTCIETASVAVGISLGDGTYRETFQTVGGPDVDSTAIADLSGDGNADLAIVSQNWTTLLVHLGKGDGSFEAEPLEFGPTGERPRFLISRDLDQDGFYDVISGDTGAATITVFWGQKGPRFLESALALNGHDPSKAIAEGDLDGDSVPDLFFARANAAEVQVYLQPGKTFPIAPALVIPVASRFSSLNAVDLNGDQVPDLAGTDLAGGKTLVALLDRQGKVLAERSLDAGVQPTEAEAGQLDASAPVDLVVPCKGSAYLALYLGQGGGQFAAARTLPSVEKPRSVAIGLVDGDALIDLAVIGDQTVAVHFGKGGGEFDASKPVLQDAAMLFTGLAVGDVTGDGRVDLVVCESKGLAALVFENDGARGFKAPSSLKTKGAPASVEMADLNGDGRLDVTTTNSTGRATSIFLNRGVEGFTEQRVYNLGLNALGHRLADFDRDGAMDLAAFSSLSAVVLFGRSASAAAPKFIRGDASLDRELAINDPIQILNRLFQGGAALGCDDAADADDNGILAVNDPILILNRLFLGGAPLPPPGPEACGDDVAADLLPCETGCAP